MPDGAGFGAVGREAMRVRDVMTRSVHTVRPDDAIEAAAALLSAHAVAAAPVVDRAGTLVGIVGEGDLLRHRVPPDPMAHLWQPAEQAPQRPKVVSDVMTRSLITAWPSEDLADVARSMIDCNVRSIPVVDHGRLVGIVSRRDIVRSVIRTDEALRDEVQHRLDEYAGRVRRWTVNVADGVANIEGAFDDPVERKVVTVMARTVPGVASVHVPDQP
jgi:CBS domain-containing protein